MSRWLAGLLSMSWIAGSLFAAPPPFPNTTQLLCRIDCAQFVAAEVIRRDVDPWKTLVAELRGGLSAIGVNPDQVEKVWFGCGEEFPMSLVVVIEGQLDTAKIDGSWQQAVRDRRFNAKVVRDADSMGYSFDLPATVLPLPGLPNKLLAAVSSPKSIAVGITKERVFEVSNPTTGAARSPIEPLVVNESTISLAWKLQNVLTAANSILAGAKQITCSIKATTELAIEIQITGDSADACRTLSESIRSGAVQVQRVFPPLARQQGTDPRLIRMLMALVAAAKIDVQEQVVVVRSTLPGDEVKKLLTK